MSSYADIAASGPSQTEEEKIPHAVPEIAHEESAPGVTVIDPLNEHANDSVSYADQQLQAERTAAARREAESKANDISKEARDFMESATASEAKLSSSSGSKTEAAKKDAKQAADKAEKKFEEVKGKAVDQYEKNVKPTVEKGKKEGKKAEQWADKNKGNPVVLGNAVVIALLGGILGVGAFRMHKAGTLTWNVVGAWAGAVGAFAIGDYYVSQFFFKKYPTEK